MTTKPIVIVEQGLLWFSVLGCTLMAGVYFAFSTFIMTAFAALDRPVGIAAMQAINAEILRSVFMPLFFGTALTSAAVAVLALTHWSAPGARLVIAASLVYLVGMFVVTVAFNVPLNDRLMANPTVSPAALPVWADYLSTWTFWNHVRTLACLVAGGLYLAALVG